LPSSDTESASVSASFKGGLFVNKKTHGGCRSCQLTMSDFDRLIDSTLKEKKDKRGGCACDAARLSDSYLQTQKGLRSCTGFEN
jgi:hypothetical protein